MKKLAFLPFLFILFSFNLDNDKNLILWKEDTKLTWDDFQQKPPREGTHAHTLAMAGCQVIYSYNHVKGKVPDFKVQAYFVKDNSWTRTDREDILRHEQLHFDITELYARKIRKGIEADRKKGITNVKIYEKKISSLLDEMHQNQLRYDRETHLMDEDKTKSIQAQKVWIDSIAIELNKLDNYK